MTVSEAEPQIQAEERRAWRRRIGLPRTGPFARYSRFVGIMKVLLPSAAAILLGLVLAWPKLTQDDARFQIGFAKLSTKEVETLSMRNARYFGVDDSNRPFSVTSELAVQDEANKDTLNLQTPKADFTSSGGANIVVDAERGLYHQAARVLDLSGGVNLFHDSGTELHTPVATIDLVHNLAHSDAPVQGFGPQGRIDSQGFDMHGKGHEIVFTGKAHLTVRAASANGKKSKGNGQGNGHANKGAKR